MNYTTAVFLINSDVRAVICTYEAEDRAPRTMFKTLDKTIQTGDFVIVPTNTRHNLTVCKVVEADADVDFDNSACVQWIVGRIDSANYQLILAQEAAAITAIKDAEKTKKRNELNDAMKVRRAELGGIVELKTLAIAGIIDGAPVPETAA